MFTVTAEIIQVVELPALPESRDNATPIIEYHDRALPTCLADTDGDGVWWLGFSHLMGNDSAYHLWSEHPQTHVRTERALVLPPPNTKIDFGGWRQNGEGPDGVVTMTVHEISNSPTRGVYVARAVLPGLFAPFRTGSPRGLAAPFGAEPSPAPQPGEPVDYEHIKADIVGEFNRLIRFFGGTDGDPIRGPIQQKVADALVWLLTAPDTDPRIAVARAFRDSYFAFHRNLVGAQLWEFAIRSGQVPPSRAPAWVHGLDGFPWGMTG